MCLSSLFSSTRPLLIFLISIHPGFSLLPRLHLPWLSQPSVTPLFIVVCVPVSVFNVCLYACVAAVINESLWTAMKRASLRRCSTHTHTHTYSHKSVNRVCTCRVRDNSPSLVPDSINHLERGFPWSLLPPQADTTTSGWQGLEWHWDTFIRHTRDLF